MQRHELTDEQWEKVEQVLPRPFGRPSMEGDRNFINGVVWIAKTGAPWRDLPQQFGPWTTIHGRFLRWAKQDRWYAIFRAVCENEDELGGMLDASNIRAHQDASGGAGGQKKTR